MSDELTMQEGAFQDGTPQEGENPSGAPGAPAEDILQGLAPRVSKKTAPARIIEYTEGHRLALPLHTTLEIVEDPEIVPVPGAAPHAIGILLWQDNWIAVVDLARLLLPQEVIAGEDKPKYVLVLAYQRVPGQPLEYCAVVLPVLPATTFVDNDMFCDLPEDSPIWPQISLSCFSYQDQPTPIVDTGRLFGRSYE